MESRRLQNPTQRDSLIAGRVLTRKLIIDGAGHWIQQERPDEVNAALIAFLK
jgi:pimeloyl-ACP methyl ester carboxylesterase